jgi:hypothetical protein
MNVEPSKRRLCRGRRAALGLGIAWCIAISLACGTSGDDDDPNETPGLTIRAATYGTALDSQFRISQPVQVFAPTDPVCLSIEIEGRPRTGTITMRWQVRSEVVNASANLADANSGVVFSIGGRTYFGGTLNHTNPLPPGTFDTVVLFNGNEVARYPFRVAPPPDAIPSVVRTAQTARGHTPDYHPVDPTTQFGRGDTVHLAGCGDFGRLTWLETQWHVAGVVNPEGTRTLNVDRNMPNVCFAFEFRPTGNWPPGQHTAVLTMNGQEVGRYPFTILP